jgi:WD40 repeat protein
MERIATISIHGRVTCMTVQDHRILSEERVYRASDCKETPNSYYTDVTVNCTGTEIACVAHNYRFIDVWDVETSEMFKLDCGARGDITATSGVKYSPSDKSILVTLHSPNKLLVWNTEFRSCFCECDTLAFPVSVCFRTRFSELVVGTAAGFLEIWGNCLPSVEPPSSSGVTVIVPVRQERIRLHSSRTESICVSSDGVKIASAGSCESAIALTELSSPEGVPTRVSHGLQGHKFPIACLAFSSSASMIVSGSYDNTVKLWDVLTRACLATLTGHKARLSTVYFAEDDRFVYSSAYDCSLRVWNLERVDSLLPLLTTQIYQPPSEEDAVKFVPSSPLFAVFESDEAFTGICPITTSVILM